MHKCLNNTDYHMKVLGLISSGVLLVRSKTMSKKRDKHISGDIGPDKDSLCIFPCPSI